MDELLKATHRQLFFITVGGPIAFQFLAMVALLFGIRSGLTYEKSLFLNILRFSPILTILSMGVIIGWFYSVGTILQEHLPKKINMKVGRFKVFLIFLVVYILFLVIAIVPGFYTGTELNPGLSNLIVPLHLFALFCMFHTLYFVAKTLRSVELQQEATASEYLEELFIFWMYPIGVWVLQPRINDIVEDDANRAKDTN